MKHLYTAALRIKYSRILQCGNALSKVADEFSLLYWNKELIKAQFEHHKIVKRAKLS